MPGDFDNGYSYDRPIGYHNVAVRYAALLGLTVGADYTRYSERCRQALCAAGEPLLSSLSSQTTAFGWHMPAIPKTGSVKLLTNKWPMPT